jgi:pimeloyl-ACP methyl ester carboxylesterase
VVPVNARVSEQAYLLGPRKSLVGIVTEGAPSEARPDRPTIVVLNAGIIHRVGPSRMNVLLARALAGSGFTVLRFDLSGLGDSEPRPDGLAPIPGGLADIREAIDWLESARGARRVVLVGLCSGANHALLYGGTDPRVAGLVLLDPATPKTFRYYVRHFTPRLFRPSVWYNVMLGRHPMVQGLAKRMAGNREEAGTPRPDLQSPEVRTVLEQAYGSALAQGVRFLVVLTGGQEHQHNYSGQVVDAFPGVDFGGRIRSEYFEGTEHTFTSEADRARLFRLVAEWIEDAGFSAGAGAGPAADARPAAD